MAEYLARPSPFFDPGPVASADSLAILHLKRDQLVPAVLHSSTEHANGYAEGAVINTRFGSFPHSTLLGNPWGSQVLASKVDTGSRGRTGTKRKRGPEDKGENDEGEDSGAGLKRAVTAGTGFIHLLPPTPESWTLSLPHRTQVVYTPDSSYVLQRLRVRPGQTVIEAGAGSGSFTHAAARAVFNGHPNRPATEPLIMKQRLRYGRVCSFEYHEPRADGLRKEIKDHGLEDVVRVTHRDVYQDGFTLEDKDEPSPKANAVFLDLPAPWIALKHLTRQRIARRVARNISSIQEGGQDTGQDGDDQSWEEPFISPLDPETPTQLCTFSPCIEQVQSTVSALRQLGWTEIEMVEVQHRRIDVRRERVGLHEEGLRGVNASASSVEEAVSRLREVEGRFKEWQDTSKDRRRGKKQSGEGPDTIVDTTNPKANGETVNEAGNDSSSTQPNRPPLTQLSRQERLAQIKLAESTRKTFKEGSLVHRTEPEIKSHTSYLVFAVLPREWADEDEARCLKQWGEGPLIKEADKVVGKKPKVQHGEPGGKKARLAEKRKVRLEGLTGQVDGKGSEGVKAQANDEGVDKLADGSAESFGKGSAIDVDNESVDKVEQQAAFTLNA